MGEPRSTRPFIARPDVVGDGNGIGRRAVVFGEKHAQAVLESKFLEGNLVRFFLLRRDRRAIGLCRLTRLRWCIARIRGFILGRVNIPRCQHRADKSAADAGGPKMPRAPPVSARPRKVKIDARKFHSCSKSNTVPRVTEAMPKIEGALSSLCH